MKFFRTTTIAIVLISLVFPIFSVEAASASFRFRSTEIGAGIKQSANWQYEIQNQKDYFGTNESVFALTRIFDISNVQTFQFKYELRGASYQNKYSQVYRPDGNWWAEVWNYDEFGRLSSGHYKLHTMISVNSGAWVLYNTKDFNVGGISNDYYCSNPRYDYGSLETGLGVENNHSFVYSITGRTQDFARNENVYALVRTNNLRSVQSFQIKFEVYLDGKNLHKSNEVAVMYPNCETWTANYSYTNLGKLPSGTHEIRAYIKLNNGSYRRMGSKTITVDGYLNENDYRYRRYDDAKYGYNWTQTDTDIKYYGNYKYGTNNPRNIFSSKEDVKVLTRLSDISNVESFKIRHELHRNGSFYTKKESSLRKPDGRDWEYNYTQSNFGRLSSGDYVAKTFISIEGGAWKYLGSVDFRVNGSGYNNAEFNYDYTQVGHEFNYNNDYYYGYDYPGYVNYPLSRNQY